MKTQPQKSKSILALVRSVNVMKPPEVRAQAAQMRQDASIMRGHAFRLQLPDAVVKTLEQQGERHAVQVSVYPSPRGVAVICATLQVGSVQMRTVCNANDVGTRGWLSSVLQLNQANWFIDVEGSKQVVWVHREMQFSDPLELLMSLSQSVHLTQDEEAYEVAFVATAIAELGALPSFLEGVSIETLVLAGQPQGRADAPTSSDQDTQTVH